MDENKFNFTMERLRRLEAQPKRSYYYDTGQPGLRLSVTPNGVKSYQFQHWSSQLGRPLTRTIGKFDTISLSSAREKAASFLAEVNKGVDIEAERRTQRELLSFGEIFTHYVETYARDRKRTWKQDVEAYNRHLKDFAGKRIDQITADLLRKLHSKLGESSGHYLANRVIDLVSSVFSHELRDKPNPCRSVTKFKEQSRDRFLQPNELEALFKSLAQESDRTIKDFFLILLFTGARKSNGMSMEWDEIDFHNEVWRIPHEKSKNQTSISIPLVPQAMEILYRRKYLTNGSFVFPSPKSKTGHIVSPKSAWARITKRADIKDIHIHDLRRTLGSWMAGSGTSTIIIGKALGHTNSSSTAVYARLNIDPVREAMSLATTLMTNGKK